MKRLAFLLIGVVYLLFCSWSCSQLNVNNHNTNTSTNPTVQAIVKPNREGHFLDRPYPSDELLSPQGTVDLKNFPKASFDLGGRFVQGWIEQIRKEVYGFSAIGAIYFQLDGELAFNETYAGKPTDPIRLYSVDQKDWIPIRVKLVKDPNGDPFFVKNTLIVVPQEHKPMLTGVRYVAEIDKYLVRSPEGYELPSEAGEAAAVATVFTVQSSFKQLQSLAKAVVGELKKDPSILKAKPLRKVIAMSYKQGETPSGKKATICTVTFEDKSQEVTYLDNNDKSKEFNVDLTKGPMDVYQTSIQTLSYQDEEGRPYLSPGMGFLNDVGREDGWLSFGKDNNVKNKPKPETMRLVIQVPRQGENFRVFTWSHGSGGDAYEAIQRTNTNDKVEQVRQQLADSGAIVISSDTHLYGQRFPMIDKGYSESLGFYNVANLVAYRSNIHQGVVDQWVLYQFVQTNLKELFPQKNIQVEKHGAFGHSLGAQIAAIAVAATEAPQPKQALLSGAGGFLSHYIVDSGLISFEGDTANLVFSLAGYEKPPENITGPSVLGAMLGVPEKAWENINRYHPAIGLFQMIADPTDPLVIARHNQTNVTVAMGTNDQHAPNAASRWLAQALLHGNLSECKPTTEYDGHYCMYRENQGLEIFKSFLGGL